MYEFCSVRIPPSLEDMRSFIAESEDMLVIDSIYKKYHEESLDGDLGRKKKKGVDFASFKELIKICESNKHKGPFAVNH
jgi:hypothetical protein